ncbi:MAG: caspase family protein [Sandaracinaceae bacterium]|nr:caspase family protein [Sandaracinaceae bacterium]
MPRTHTSIATSLARLAPLALLLLLHTGATPAPAQAQPAPADARPQRLDLAPDAHAYALVVGSNPGGPGQEPLAFAERDAQRMAEVLVELGHYPAGSVDLLRSPTRAQLAGALRRLRQRLATHAARDEQSVVFFYYSGHAQAQALRLGGEEFPLSELRAAIDALPTTLTLVVLDACQSGAYSRVRGADATADFSHNSITQLQTRGVAVMASSSGDELSQESERLSAGYFTHHLLVALRGGADEDRDGRVALDEAYRYAYAQTLLDTSRTAVGGQHVTLVTNLTGHGAVALTYPARASAQLELPAALEGQLLITRARGDAVMAELTKASGAALRLALPPGRYHVLWRGQRVIRSCDITLPARGVHTLSASSCQEITAEQATAREARTGPTRTWAFELGFGFGRRGRASDYTQRLNDFGFTRGLFSADWTPRMALAVERTVSRHFSVLLTFDQLEVQRFDRVFFDDSDDDYSWRAWSVGAQLRGTVPLAGHWLYGYAQGGLGLGIARTRFNPGREQEPTNVLTDYGVTLSAALGLRVMPGRRAGFYLQGGYSYAPILRNNLGDRHDSGGPTILTGFQAQF